MFESLDRRFVAGKATRYSTNCDKIEKIEGLIMLSLPINCQGFVSSVEVIDIGVGQQVSGRHNLGR